MQLVEPGTPGEGDIPATGGGRFDTPDEDRATSPFQKYFHTPSDANKPGTKTDFSRVDTTPHGVEALAS